MGGRGASSSGGGGRLTNTQKQSLINGIRTHSSEASDRAEQHMKDTIAKEKKILDNYDTYKAIGKVKNKNDEWWKDHENTYKNMTAKLKFFQQERKRQGK